MAKKIVDFIVNDPYCNSLSENLLLDFIGGEPLLEIELIDKVSDYCSLLLYSKGHKWFDKVKIKTWVERDTLFGGKKKVLKELS